MTSLKETTLRRYDARKDLVLGRLLRGHPKRQEIIELVQRRVDGHSWGKNGLQVEIPAQRAVAKVRRHMMTSRE
jgi:hypothetical protein